MTGADSPFASKRLNSYVEVPCFIVDSICDPGGTAYNAMDGLPWTVWGGGGGGGG